jgi:hypothetical protein
MQKKERKSGSCLQLDESKNIFYFSYSLLTLSSKLTNSPMHPIINATQKETVHPVDLIRLSVVDELETICSDNRPFSKNSFH